MDKLTNRQADKQTNRQSRQADKQTNRQTNKNKNKFLFFPLHFGQVSEVWRELRGKLKDKENKGRFNRKENQHNRYKERFEKQWIKLILGDKEKL